MLSRRCLGTASSFQKSPSQKLFHSWIASSEMRSFLLFCSLALASRHGSTALLMSELPTPSLVLDVQAVQRHDASGQKSSSIPCLEFSNDQGY